MFYNQTENKYINDGMAFTLNGVHYPSGFLNSATPQEKEAMGLVEVVTVGEAKDPKYYWVGETLEGSVRTLTATPKDLADIQKQAIAQVNASAYSILLPSDYMAGKAYETNTPVPTAWATWREAVRQVARTAIASINVAVDVDAVASVSVEFPKDPDNVELPIV